MLDFGAVADAKTDNTAAFQAAMDAANRGGATLVTVPEGSYLFRGRLTIPDSVMFEGTWRMPPMDHYRRNREFTAENFVGPVLLVTDGKGNPDGPPFIALKSNAGIKGLTIFYPEQTKTNLATRRKRRTSHTAQIHEASRLPRRMGTGRGAHRQE